MLVTPALLVMMALYLHEWMRRLLNDPKSLRRVAFVGCTEVSLMLADRITRNSRSLGMTVHGFFDDRGPDRLGHCGSMRRLGSMSEIVSAVQRNQLDAIFVALPIRQVPRVMELVQELRNTTVSIYYLPDICALDLIQARTGELLGMPVVSMCETPFYGYGGLVKRMTDVAFALAILLFAAPLMVMIALAVKFTSHGPALFKQRRYGLDGREILVYKFRTMTVLEDGNQVHQATRTDSRITRVGALPPSLLAGRTAAALQRALGHDESGRSATACGRPQRRISPAHQGLHGSPQGAAGNHRPRADQRLPWRNGACGRHAGARQLRPRVPASLVAAARPEDSRAHRRPRAQGRQGVLILSRLSPAHSAPASCQDSSMRIGDQAAILTLSRLASFGLMLIGPLLLVRLVPIDEFGRYREFVLYAALLQSFATFAIPDSLLYFIPAHPQSPWRLVRQTAILTALASVLVVACLIGADLILGGTLVGPYLVPLALYTLFVVNLDFWEFLLIALRRPRDVMIYTALRLAARMIVAVGAAALTHSVFVIIWSLVVLEGVRVAIAAFAWRAMDRASTEPAIDDGWRRQLRFCFPTGLSMLLAMARRNIATVAVVRLLGLRHSRNFPSASTANRSSRPCGIRCRR